MNTITVFFDPVTVTSFNYYHDEIQTTLTSDVHVGENVGAYSFPDGRLEVSGLDDGGVYAYGPGRWIRMTVETEESSG